MKQIIKKLIRCLCSAVAATGLAVSMSSCGGGDTAKEQGAPHVAKPLSTDLNEAKWRIYFEDQFEHLGTAPLPGAADPDVAWTAYYAEKKSHGIRENKRAEEKSPEGQEKMEKLKVPDPAVIE